MITTNPPNVWPAPGIHPGIEPEVYFADNSSSPAERIVSKSMLWKFAKNPRRWRDSPPLVPTAAMRWGSLVDCLALTPDRFPTTYVAKPETYLAPESAKKDAPMISKPWNANSNTCKAWMESLPAGVEIISSWETAEAQKAVASLYDRKEFRSMKLGSQTQVGMRIDLGAHVHGHDWLTIPAKMLMDIVPDRDGDYGDALVDLKTTGRLDDMDQVEKTIYSLGYHGQAALYLDAFNAITGENRTEFFFVFQLAEPPYEVAIVQLSDDALLAGRNWYRDALHKWGKVVLTGEWESPWDGIQVANLPKWAARKEDA